MARPRILGLTVIALVLFARSGLDSFAVAPQQRAVVTGAAGFLGRELCCQLLEAGWQVTALVRDASSERTQTLQELATAISGRFQAVELDLLDEDAFTSLLQDFRPDAVFHLAGVFRRVADSAKDMVEPNIAMAEVVVRSCAKLTHPPLIVFTSSMAAVRGAGQPLRDGCDCYDHEDYNSISRPERGWGEAYQYSKVESERRARALSEQLRVPMVSLCPSFILGPERRVPSRTERSLGFSCSMVQGWLHGEQKVRSLLIVDVRDVAKAHVAAASGKAAGERIIVSNEVRPLPEEVAKVLESSGAPGPIRAAATPSDTAEPPCLRPGANEVRCAERLEALLGVACRPAEDTVRDMAHDLIAMDAS